MFLKLLRSSLLRYTMAILTGLIILFFITSTAYSARGGRITITVKANYAATLQEPPSGLPFLEFTVKRSPYVENVSTRNPQFTRHSIQDSKPAFSRDNVDARFFHILEEIRKLLEIEGPGRRHEVVTIAFDDFRRMVHQAAFDQLIQEFGQIALDTGFKILAQFTGGLSVPRQLLITTFKEFVNAYLKGGDIKGLQKAALNETIGLARKIGVSDEVLNSFLDAVMLARSAIENWLKDLLKIQSLTGTAEDSQCSWHLYVFWDPRTGDCTARFTKICGDPQAIETVTFKPGQGKPGDTKTVPIAVTNIQGAGVVIKDFTLNGLDAVMEDGANYNKNGLGTATPSVTFAVAKPRKDGVYNITGTLITARNERISVRGNFEVLNVGPKITEVSPSRTSADPGESMQLSTTITVIDDNADKNNVEEVRERSINLTGHPSGLRTSKDFRRADTVNRTNHDPATGTYTFVLSRDGGDVDYPHEHDVYTTSIRVSDNNGVTDEKDIELEVNDVEPKALDFEAVPDHVHSGDGVPIEVKGTFIDGNGYDDITGGFVDCKEAGGDQYFYQGQPALIILDQDEDFIKVKTPSWSHTDDEGLYPIPVEVKDEKNKASGEASLHVGNLAPMALAWGYIYGHDIGVRPESSKLLCPNDPFKVGIMVEDPEGDELQVKATIVETGQTVVLEQESGNKTYTGILIAPGKSGKYTIRFDAVETKTKRKKALPPTFSPLEVDPCAEANVTNVDVAARITKDNRQALLIKVAGDPGANCDEIRFKVSKKIASEASSGLLPEGWALDFDKDILKISGSKVSIPCYLWLDIGKSKPPKKVDVEVMLEGERLFHKKGAKVALHTPYRVSANFDDLLKFPPLICPGELIEFMPLDFNRTPLGGTWMVAGKTAVEIRGKDRYVVALPDNLKEGDSISLSYTDPYGIELYRTEALPEIKVASCPEGNQPVITDVTRLVFPGDMICVCGLFPDINSRYGLFLNGQSVSPPVTASSQVVILRLPEDISLGTQRIGGNPEAGYAEDNELHFKVIQVNGYVDRDTLLRGESTQLKLWIEGTDEVLQLELENTTPNIISLEGGDHQVVSTSGGEDNKVERVVKGIRRGDFNLNYTLVLDFCPCKDF
jgi:hypothetical protein